jgi:predicted short-subunit dehydrogenase-like oxidoreductase (DUF2520 family)
MKDTNLKILLIGAGNLAWHLGPALQKSGYQVVKVYSRTPDSAKKLGTRMGIPFSGITGPISEEADMILICISDSAIEPVLDSIQGQYSYMVHTAGSLPASVFEGRAEHYGVLYPLMTFTVDRSLDLGLVPIILESSGSSINKVLKGMAGSLSSRVYHFTLEERIRLHLAAVIAANFSNHMYHLAADYLSGEGLDFELLRPIISETAGKVMTLSPRNAQTGPARRQDRATMDSHLELMKRNPELQNLYTFVSESIRKTFSVSE